MKDSSCLSRPLQYYCTAGKGMEQFLAAEVKCKLAANDVDVIMGKVFFTTSADIKQVRGLKSAERLFLLLRRGPSLSQTGNTGTVEELIQGLVVGQRRVWTEGLSQWQSLRERLEGADPGGPDRNSPKTGRKRKREEGEDEGDGERSEPQAGACRVGPPSSEEGDISKPQPAPVPFRVCCRSSGSVARSFTCQDLGRIIGTAISRQLGWRVNLRDPELEVSVHLSDDHCVIGLPLLRLPLANRSYIRTTGLRSTVAWAMATLAEIKPGSYVLDPMCGVGMILLEAAKECPNSFFLGMDIDGSQLGKARGNVQYAELAERVELMQSSVTAIPVPSCSVDAVICDIPFGKKFGSKADMEEALPGMVGEMERVLCFGGALVLLLSPALSSVLKRSFGPQSGVLSSQPGEPPPQPLPQDTAAPPSHSASPSSSPLRLQSVHRVSLGTADALIHTYRKVPPMQQPS
ncbi:hypothetical protein JZ751_018514 [Albula glossodonta]|uniref:THUMP domain-containing protein n=1 Tax=Albula glossodonta TaxID=121402 RepID=A0A8T2NW23_9TELE|nr:hypothetical protein JZ751_018514 [Albula glossodonta]